MESISLNEIAGDHLQIYEKYYQEVNTSNTNIIKALDAASFLRKSGLNELTLRTIWDFSDPNCLGFLDKKAFFISLKLIAMVQNGHEINSNNLKTSLPPPIIGDDVLNSIDWCIPQANIQKYIQIFNSLNPIDGKLSGSKVKPYMVNSKLPVDALKIIWDLSDIDQDGFFNLKEFILSCHLINKAKQGFILPSTLPPVLLNFNPLEKRESFSPVISPSNEANFQTPDHWVVPPADKKIYDENFAKLDRDKIGYVTGLDVKDTLCQSGLAQNVLAHIWNLCDIKGNGKLNSEQFALANYFIKQKQNGFELPMQLAPNMVPPTLRPKPNESSSNENLNNVTNHSISTTGNKELDSLAEEIKQLQLEKVRYESEVVSEEASLRLKQSEAKSIQNEIETLSQMLKQLENQKNDASKRLEDLSAQLNQFNNNLHVLKSKFSMELEKVANLNRQYSEQKKLIEDQQLDLKSKKIEFENLQNEESTLENKLKTSKSETEQISNNSAEIQLKISQLKAKYVELEDYEQRSNEILDDFDNAIRSQDFVKIASLLPRNVEPPQFLSEDTQSLDEFNVSKTEFSADPFAGEDPFKDDVFASSNPNDVFGSDNFANFDAFSNSNSTFDNKNDPFGSTPFDAISSASSKNDPFRSESPTPALPPKRSKAPPPRPAPPKSGNKTPLRAAPPPPSKELPKSATNSTTNFHAFDDNRDPFGSDSFASQNFANFADFDKS